MPKKIALKGNNEIQVKKILFITLSNLGDAILTTPALEAINIKYPNALIDIVGDKKSICIFKQADGLFGGGVTHGFSADEASVPSAEANAGRVADRVAPLNAQLRRQGGLRCPPAASRST